MTTTRGIEIHSGNDGIKKKAVQKNDAQNIPKPYLDVARGMEQQFIKYMIEQMKKTISKAEPESSALKFYNSLLNHHQSNIMAQKNEGLGLQKVILDQIYPAYKRNQKLSSDYGVKKYKENSHEQY